jgi:hypothetical protein
MTLTDRIKALRIGRSFKVDTHEDRQRVLDEARRLLVRVVTRKRKRGGFTVMRLPE